MLLVAVVGLWIGAALAPSTPAYVGPLTATVRVVPSLDPGIRLLLPPAGEVSFPTHASPVAVEARIREVDPQGARELISSPAALLALQRSAPDALRSAILRAAVTTTACALVAALALSLLVHRRAWRRTGEVAGVVVLVLTATGVATAATASPDALATPRFHGLLSQAPYVAGSASSMLDRLESYRSGLADIVEGVATLYATAGQLPVLPDAAAEDLVTVLHVSDIHLNPLAYDLIDRLTAQFSVDLVVDTGDVTTWGTPVESGILGRIGSLDVPYVLVRGNHDSAETERAVAANDNAVVLDGTVAEVGGVVLAGVGDPVFTPEGTVSALDAAGAEEGAAEDDSADSEAGGQALASPTSAAATPLTTGGTTTLGPTGSGEATEPAPAPAPDARVVAGQRLAAVIAQRRRHNPDRPVSVALVHDPVMAQPLMGQVPLVLAGHLHSRSERVDATGTRLMVQGTTGGAGLTARGLERLDDGDPLPMQASVLYLARTGSRAGRLVGWDEVSVGGFGLASVSLERHVVREEDAPSLPLTPALSQVPGGASTPSPAVSPSRTPVLPSTSR
jgi:predicted MPP superfamily phosphohydrolase